CPADDRSCSRRRGGEPTSSTCDGLADFAATRRGREYLIASFTPHALAGGGAEVSTANAHRMPASVASLAVIRPPHRRDVSTRRGRSNLLHTSALRTSSSLRSCRNVIVLGRGGLLTSFCSQPTS